MSSTLVSIVEHCQKLKLIVETSINNFYPLQIATYAAVYEMGGRSWLEVFITECGRINQIQGYELNTFHLHCHQLGTQILTEIEKDS